MFETILLATNEYLMKGNNLFESNPQPNVYKTSKSKRWWYFKALQISEIFSRHHQAFLNRNIDFMSAKSHHHTLVLSEGRYPAPSKYFVTRDFKQSFFFSFLQSMMRPVFHSFCRNIYINNFIILRYQILQNIIFVSFMVMQKKTKPIK